ncbi:MAG: hypothetical protein GXY60_12305, partial [Spirochaetales bacterium]|nr:hypothetical protein [Spirochaetales bacterium]
MKGKYCAVPIIIVCTLCLFSCIKPVPDDESGKSLSDSHPIRYCTFDGTGIGSFVIISPGGQRTTSARLIQNAIKSATGHELEIRAGSASTNAPHAIILGSANFRNSKVRIPASNRYLILSDGKDVYITGNDEIGEIYAVKQFIYNVIGYNTKTLTAKTPDVRLKSLSIDKEVKLADFTHISPDEEYYAYAVEVAKVNGPFEKGLNFNTFQGSATDGNYLYACLLNKATDAGGCTIFKIDLSDWSFVHTAPYTQVGHGNDAAYIPDMDKLAVVDLDNPNRVHFLNTATLEIEFSKNLGFHFFCMSYNAATKKYAFAQRFTQNLFVTDSDFNVQKQGSFS